MNWDKPQQLNKETAISAAELYSIHDNAKQPTKTLVIV